MGKKAEKGKDSAAERRQQAKDAGGGDPFARVLQQVTEGMARVAEESGLVGMPLVEAAAGVLEKAVVEATGKDGDLEVAAKAILVGALMGAGEQGEAALQVVTQTSRGVLVLAARKSGDLGAAAKGVVLGAIASAGDLGLDRSQLAMAAAQGALQGAGSDSLSAVERVRAALKDPIGGIPISLPDPKRG